MTAIVCHRLRYAAGPVGPGRHLHERHRRFWLDRSVDELKLSLAAIRPVRRGRGRDDRGA